MNWNKVLTSLLIMMLLGCAKKEEIRIAAILPLTGTAAQWGNPAKDAATMAVDEVNAEGGINGRTIRLEIEDDQCEPAKGVSGLQKILSTGKPVAILGAVCSSVSVAIAPIAEQNKTVMISPASTSPLLTNAGDYIFRVIPTDALRGKAFAEYVFSVGHKKVCILHINNEGGSGNQKTFAENFQRLGGNILSVEAYAQDSRDMRAQLTKIKKEKPDALVVVSYPDDTPLVLRQAQELKVSVPLFFQTEALDDPAVLLKAGNAAEGVTYILPARPEGAVADEFAAKYRKRYKHDPELFTAEAYDCIMLIAKAIEQSKTANSDSLKFVLYRTSGYIGASGTTSFDSNGDVVKPMAIKQVKSGHAKTILIR